MALFEMKDLQQPVDDSSGSDSILDKSRSESRVLKNRAAIDAMLDKFDAGMSVHYVTGGLFSSHDLMFSILERTGPAVVYITTWTMTEYPARQLTEALTSGLIRELYCILDVRMEKNPNVFQLIRNNSTKIRLSNCHAKVMVIEGEFSKFTVISSQNMTENPRIEAGVICSDHLISDFHKKWILKEIEDGHAIE
jgi:hypothetical protein